MQLPDITSDLLMWTVLIGTGLPVIIALINRTPWSPQAKGLCTLIVAAVVGAGTAYFNGAFTGRGIVSSILIVFVMAIATYQYFWKPSGIAPGIERATTPSSSSSLH